MASRQLKGALFATQKNPACLQAKQLNNMWQGMFKQLTQILSLAQALRECMKLCTLCHMLQKRMRH